HLIRMLRLFTLTRLGRHELVSREVEELAQRAELTPPDFYNLACSASLACADAAVDDRLEADHRAGLSTRYVLQALDLLERASAGDFFSTQENQEFLQTDPDLAALQGRP